MVFRFNIEKTIQAVAAFLHFHGSREMSYLRWKKNDPGKSSKPIRFEDILAAIGRSADREAILQDARDQAAFDRLSAAEAR